MYAKPIVGFAHPWAGVIPALSVKKKTRAEFTLTEAEGFPVRTGYGGAGRTAASPPSRAGVEELDHGLKELGGGRAVNHSMVECEAQPEHRALNDLAAIDGGLLDDSPDA